MGVAEEAIAAPATGRVESWASEACTAAQTLQKAFEIHIDTTEDPDGILEEIIRMSPRLSSPVTRLRREHATLREGLSSQISALDSPPAAADAKWVNDRREAMIELLARLARHRQQGADLTYEAYGVDIGGET
jgi:hypothetical protein